jgi:hypothetical protein
MKIVISGRAEQDLVSEYHFYEKQDPEIGYLMM